MGKIVTTYDLDVDLTVVTATGRMVPDDFRDWTANYYTGTVTSFVLWDITQADMSELKSGDLRDDAEHTKSIADVRKGGRTAIVTGNDLEYGMSRMLEAFYGLEDMPFEVQVFRDFDEAKKWLGV